MAVITSGNEPLVDLPPIEERFEDAKGKEAPPTGPIPSVVFCQQHVHQGSLGLHQPLISVVKHGLTAMSGLSQETPTTPKADMSQQPLEHDPMEGLLYDPMSDAGLGRRLESGVPVPEAPVGEVKSTGTIPKQRKEKKKESVGVATQTTTTRGRGRRSHVPMDDKDIVFRMDKAVQTPKDRSNLSDLPGVAGPPVLRDVWDAGWRPVPIVHDTIMNRFRSRKAELREETRRQMGEARAYINWELQFQSPAAIDRQEVEFYQRMNVMGPVHSLTACPIELREVDCRSSTTELPAPSVASTSLSSKVDRCWNCQSEGHRYTQKGYILFSVWEVGREHKILCKRILPEEEGV